MDSNKSSSGGPVEVEDLDPRYECPICLTCLKDPVQTICGHRFCSSCLRGWLDNNGGCPVDATPLHNTTIFPDNYTRREILGQRTMCRMCSAEVSLAELDDHVASHVQQCPFADVGCLATVSRDDLQRHLEAETQHHLGLMREAVVGAARPQGQDGRSQEAQMWDPDEKGQDPSGGDGGQTSLMRALYERVVVLEQRAHEHDAHAHKMRSEVARLEARLEEMSRLLSGGQHIWRIHQFQEKLEAMRSQRGCGMLYSEGFYTSPAGYRLCARLNISPDSSDCLALFVHVMRSPHDAALDWPLNCRIHLAVVHPQDPGRSVRETMMSRPEIEAFRRPRGELNTKAFGYTQFVAVEDLLQSGFLVGGTLMIKIHVQCV